MKIYNRFFILVVMANAICATNLLATIKNPEVKQAFDQYLKDSHEMITKTIEECKISVALTNQAIAYAYAANGTSIEAFKKAEEAVRLANDAVSMLNKIRNSQENIGKQIQDGIGKLNHECKKLKASLDETAKKQNGFDVKDKIKIERAKINEKKKNGIYAQEAQIQAEASVEVEKARWEKLREIISDPILLTKIVLAITAIALSIYTIKYGIPILMDYLTQPCVISETSRPSWFGWGDPEQSVDINDLFFSPSLNKQLSDLFLRVQSANNYGENLPNVLFYGPSGTGKTAYAKALAYNSGLDYALTSGSEFAKITDLNLANKELRKLLNWAKNTDKGLILFIDEAESLFANRKLSTTSKATVDLINTFLSLISDQSQQKLILIFATNHPFKLDDAIANRIGINIQFTTPEAPEREKILLRYLTKFAQENKEAIVEFCPEIISSIAQYAEQLEGFSPRTIKFIAETMIIKARRQLPCQLTNSIVQETINEAKSDMQQTMHWKKECDEWIRAQAIDTEVLP